jgi:hypothetical protein
MCNYTTWEGDLRGLRFKVSNTLLKIGIYKQTLIDFMYKWETLSRI